MKKNFKSLLFVVVGILFFLIIQWILIPSWKYIPDRSEGETDRYLSFYDLSENSLDYITIGNSFSFYSTNPMQIYARTGYRGYNLGSPSQSIEISYYWLKEAFKTQKPKIVFLEVYSLLKNYYISDENASKALIYMKPSIDKAKACIESIPSDAEDIILPILQFHSRWNSLSENDWEKQSENYFLKGAYIGFNSTSYTNKDEINTEVILNYEVFGNSVQIETEYPEIGARNRYYFKQILDLCEDNNVQLIPTKFPTNKWGLHQSEIITSFLSEYNLNLLDLNNLIEIEWSVDTMDSGQHTNFWGSTKASYYIANFLLANLGDHQPNETDKLSWDKDLNSYIEWEKEQLTSDYQKSLLFLQKLIDYKNNFMIFVSVKDEACDGWNPIIQNAMESLGFQSDFYNNLQNSFIGVIDSGKIVFEQWEEAPMNLSTQIQTSREAADVKIISGGFAYGNISSIMIQNQEYSLNNRGLNIVVWDKKSEQVISSVSIDTHDSRLIFEKKILSSDQEKVWNDIYPYMQILEDGIYSISYYPNNYVFEVKQGSIIPNEQIVLGPQNGLFTQQFKLSYIGDGCYTIQAMNSELFLTVAGGIKTMGANIVQERYTGLSDQSWIIVNNMDDTYSIISLYNGLRLSADKETEILYNIKTGDINNYDLCKFYFKRN